MEENPLQAYLDNLGESIGVTFGMLYQVEAHLRDYKKILIQRFELMKEKINYPVLATTLVIGDLTGDSDNGWKINFPTDYSFELWVNDIDYKIDLLIDRESMRSIAYCYEVLEKYLYDVTAIYLFHNRIKYADLIERIIKPLDETSDSYFYGIRKLRGRNNRDILSLLRKLSDHFDKAESKNNEGIDLKEWFEVLSKVRHAIIHSNFRLKKDSKQLLTSSQYDLLSLYFPHVEEKDFYEFKIKRSHAEKMLRLITEYGILVFKSLSIEGGYNWKVFKNMDGLKSPQV
jgi:hypothetical protein